MRLAVLGHPADVDEGRVLVTPRLVGVLDAGGVRVAVQSGAGRAGGFDDADFGAEGATVHPRRAEVIGGADVILSVARLTPEECAGIKAGAVVLGMFHATEDAAFIGAANARGATVISLDRACTPEGRHPFRERMAEVAGAVCVHLAAELLLRHRGVLLGALPGIPSVDVVVLGAGHLGRAAVRAFAGAGASVLLMDRDLAALEAVEREHLRLVRTMLAGPAEIADAAAWADVLVGAVRVADGPAPKLLSALQGKPGAVWLDLSVDEGGCIRESRPVYRADEAFSVEGVLCCPVPNLASWAAGTASRIASSLLAPALLRAMERSQLDLNQETWLLAGILRSA